MEVIIRLMVPDDADAFTKAFAAIGWNKPHSLFAGYLKAQASGDFRVFVAEVDSVPAGYVLLHPQAKHGPYAGKGIPEIVDFNVLPDFRNHGVGSALMDAAEAAAGDRVCLGVGLHAGYGPAQRLYIRRGYQPDGSGVWYRNEPLTPYAPCVNDDDLVLYMAKG